MNLNSMLSSEDDIAQPKKSPPSLDSILKTFAALMTLVSVLFGWTGNHPVGTKILAAVGALVFLWIVGPYASESVGWVRQTTRDRVFRKREDTHLRQFVNRFARFISTNDNRSIVCTANSVMANNIALAGKLPDWDCANAWLRCFQEQLNAPVRSLVPFLQRCGEFGTIVSLFNRSYVQPVQKCLAQATVQEHYLDQLEVFKDEFNDFLRALESWSVVIFEFVRNREICRLSPTVHFDRVNTFRRVKIPAAISGD
jgi:hypothetical protein